MAYFRSFFGGGAESEEENGAGSKICNLLKSDLFFRNGWEIRWKSGDLHCTWR